MFSTVGRVDAASGVAEAPLPVDAIAWKPSACDAPAASLCCSIESAAPGPPTEALSRPECSRAACAVGDGDSADTERKAPSLASCDATASGSPGECRATFVASTSAKTLWLLPCRWESALRGTPKGSEPPPA